MGYRSSLSGGNEYPRTDSVAAAEPYRPREVKQCAFDGCSEPRHSFLPLCFVCAMSLARFMRDLWVESEENPEVVRSLSPDQRDELTEFAASYAPPETPERTSVVYYLMLSPTTVKIGITTNLKLRLSSLRSELQYVVALEIGDRQLERDRHLQFAADRRPGPRREDFRLSPALKRHVDQLAPQREEILQQVWGTPI